MADDAHSFGTAAASYDRYRPSYPPEAVDWALLPAAPPARPLLPAAPLARPLLPAAPLARPLSSPADRLRVADLGAGTGILTRVILRQGHHVVPVEPDESMRAQLTAATPESAGRGRSRQASSAGVVPLGGSAESIPLPDDSVDAVVAGQAYHWFDPARAPAEIARVLRPGGVFAAVWNLRDESEPWVARLTEVAHLRDQERHHQGLDEQPLRAAGFGPVTRAVFAHAVDHTPDTLVELIKTRSYYLTAPAGGQAEIVAAVRSLAATHPDLAGRDTFPLPYHTVVFRTSLPR